MIVCQCTGTSDHQIKRALREGAASRVEIQAQCGAGGVCGGCVPTIACLMQGQSPTQASDRFMAGAALPARA